MSFLGIFISMSFLVVAITCSQEEQSIYLVLLEGDALAFHEGSRDQDSSTIHPNTNRLIYIAARLRSSPGVKLVEKDRGAKMTTTYTPEFLSLRKGIWAQEGGDRNAGDEVVIGYVDSGINALHPSFAYDPMHPFSSNLSHFEGATCETGPLFPPSSCNGKIVAANHVASVAAGNAGVPVVANGFFYGNASGMAPRARIAVYKAIFPSVGTLADVIAAIDQSNSKKEEVKIFKKAGVFVVQAAGNKGPASSSVVSFGPWSVGVAACTTDRRYPASLLGNGSLLNGAGLSAKDAVKTNETTLEYIEECQHPEVLGPNIVMGNIIICTFSAGFNNGTSTLDAIIGTSKALGLEGFILVANPNYGDYIAEPIPFDVSGILIPRVDDAKELPEFCAMAAVGEGRVASFTGRSPVVSRFSSRGPDIIDMHNNLADVLKPDILDMGSMDPHQCLRTYDQSMSTPHLAGIAALIKQYNPLWTPSMIASAISTTSSKYDNLGEHMMAEGFEASSLLPSTPFEYGAGLVSPNCAIDPGLVLSSEHEDFISFLCSLPNMDTDAIIAATGDQCNHPYAYPFSLNLPSVTISALRGSVSVWRTLMSVGNNTETYFASVQPPKGTKAYLYPTWFTISPQGTQDLEIQLSVIQPMSNFTFGEIVLTGNLNHIVRITLSVLAISV
ncbi:Subtilisin-like protease SBT2.4 [Glycine max]|nr:Subtilisin-like protease SBT2.4 [Glycine max]